MITCHVDITNPKMLPAGTDTDATWRREGHDAVRADATNLSQRSEWCIADPSAIHIVLVHEVCRWRTASVRLLRIRFARFVLRSLYGAVACLYCASGSCPTAAMER